MKATKTSLEKKLNELARERFMKDLIALQQVLIDNPISNKLRIFGVNEKREKVDYPLVSDAQSLGVINASFNNSTPVSDFNRVKEELIDRYEREELDKILKWIENPQAKV